VKQRQAADLGFDSPHTHLPSDATQEDLHKVIHDYSNDPAVHGMLVQHPIPGHLDYDLALASMNPDKDVDGFSPVSLGRLMRGEPGNVPCTPQGVMRLLREGEVPLSGAHAVVVGRSLIVGKPQSMLLLAANCTVTVAHSRTRDLPALCRQADILVAAVGRPEMVRGDWVRPGAAVIDVGINRTEDGLRGDVAFDEAAAVAAWITPVPGGVGPTTIAYLLANTLEAAIRRSEADA